VNMGKVICSIDKFGCDVTVVRTPRGVIVRVVDHGSRAGDVYSRMDCDQAGNLLEELRAEGYRIPGWVSKHLSDDALTEFGP